VAPSDSSKPKRGLPSSFQINVPTTLGGAPVQLSEYLDDDSPSRARPDRPVQQREPENRVVSFPRQEPAPESSSRIDPDLRQEVRTDDEGSGQRLHDFQPAKKQSRKQVNMNPETLQMVDELLDQICTQCVQGDVKASELFHALVSTLYESRELLHFGQVKPRGKWGSPTAKAFPVSLKNAFRSAIAQGHAPGKS
jgi:hypothetical protein